MKIKEILENFNLNPYTDKDTTHCYVDEFYEKTFSKYQNKEISLLEIGISLGASLKLWKEYFVNAKTIVGIDNRPEVIVNEFRDIDGVTYYFEDAYSENIIPKLPKFDIIIDDGAHYVETQAKAIDLYLPLLKKNGIYVVEDIDGSSINSDQKIDYSLVKQILTEKLNTENCKSYEWLDLRSVKNRPDDTLLVIKK